MSSLYSPWYKRKILYKIPFLYKVPECGNYHLSWDRLCFCEYNENGTKIVDLKTGQQYEFMKFINE